MADIESAVEQAGNRQGHRVFGKYRGLVSDNMDPLKMGRIQAIVPELLGGIATGWATPCAPVGGIRAGFYSIPMVGSGVWIEFEAGDVSRPIWVGGYWGSSEAPNVPPSSESPQPTQKIWRSDTGLTVAMDDAQNVVTITDGLGLNKISMDVTSGTVTISGLARVVLDAPKVQDGSASAAHPSVLGDQLLSYLAQIVATFNAHVHPGELALGFMPVTPAPPVAPMVPPTAALVSSKVFLE